jgi:hypothetical protein
MPLPWRSSPGATTHLPRPLRRPLLLAHSSLPHHRLPPRRRPLSLVLLPPGRAGVGGGAWGPPRPPWAQWWESLGSWDAAHPGSDPPSRSPSRRCALADSLPPVVRAYLHVALPGSGRGGSSSAPADGHGHECCLLRADRDSTSSTQLVVPGGGWDAAALAQSFSTVGLTPPVGTEWIADSGASYHTTPDAGILSSVRPPHSSCPSSIMVGDGSCLPVTSVGSAPGPFRLSDVLVAP